jgi:hypothetical protein
MNALQVRLAAAREEPEAQAALAEEVLAQGVSPGVLLGALKDPDLVWALDFWRRLAQDFRTPPDVLVALLEHPWATLTQEAARTLVDHPGATEKHLWALGRWRSTSPARGTPWPTGFSRPRPSRENLNRAKLLRSMPLLLLNGKTPMLIGKHLGAPPCS